MIIEPEGGLFNGDGTPVPLESVRLTGTLAGRAFAGTLVQRFVNREAVAIEAVYKFPLPDTATVHAFRIRRGDVLLESAVEEREEAFRLYDEALERGHGAGLLEEERPNLFTLSVGNLPPGESAVIEIDWVDLCPRQGATVRLAIPTVIAPRYVPPDLPDEAGIPVAETVNPPFVADAGYRLSVEITVHDRESIAALASPSHPIRTSFAEKAALVGFSAGEAVLDRDFVLEVTYHGDRRSCAYRDDAGYLALELVPPAPDAADTDSRHLVFLLDCSGSMSGPSITQAKAALAILLAALEERHSFSIIRFGSSHEPYRDSAEPATAAALTAARAWLGSVGADLGGTELLTPLEAILGKADAATEMILLTDGETGDEERILGAAAGSPARIFTVGIGHGPNAYLLRELARRSGGSYTPVAPGERLEPAMLALFPRLFAPRLALERIDWGGDAVPAALPRGLYPGEMVAVFARCGEKIPEQVSVGLVSGDTRVGLAVPVTALPAGQLPLAALWARARIRDLEAGEGGGSRQVARKETARRAELIALSKASGVLCGETAFVAIETRAGAVPGEAIELRRVPVTLVAGWGGLEGPADMALCCAPVMLHPPPYPACDAAPISPGEPGPTRRKRKKSLILHENCFRIHDAEAEQDADATTSVDDPLFRVLGALAPGGWFKLDEAALSGLCGIPEAEFRAALAALRLPETTASRLLVTAFVLAWLEAREAGRAGLWEPLVAKSRRWLARELAEHGDPPVAGKPLGEWAREKVASSDHPANHA